MGNIDGDGDLDAFVEGVWLNRTSQSVFPFLPGEANRDGHFDQRDIVQVLQAAKFLTGESATFEQGDWNTDGAFNQLDIVAALQTGIYLSRPSALRAVDAAIADYTSNV